MIITIIVHMHWALTMHQAWDRVSLRRHIIRSKPSQEDIIMIPILEMRNRKSREVKYLLRSHVESRFESGTI